MLTGKWLLPAKKNVLPENIDTPERRFFRVELAVEEGGALVGKTIDDAGLLDSEGFEIICFHRGPRRLDVRPDTILQANDKIGFSTDIVGAKSLWVTIGLIPFSTTKDQKAERHRHHLVEVVVSRRNTMLGLLVGDVEKQDQHHKIWLVGFARGESAMHYPLHDAVIQSGDVVLLEVTYSFFYQNRNEIEFSTIKKLSGAQIQRTDKALTASFITVSMVISVAFGLMSMLNASLLAAGAMLFAGCMNLHDAGKSVDFATLMVIAAAMGLESAVTASGLSEILGGYLGALGGDNVYLALTVVFLGCIAMDAMVTNVASAVFMFPISMTIASGLGVSFMPFVLTVMVGASCSFISPVSYQTNLMVYGPGEYTFGDFVKIGIPLSLIVGVLTVFLAPMIFPFHP